MSRGYFVLPDVSMSGGIINLTIASTPSFVGILNCFISGKVNLSKTSLKSSFLSQIINSLPLCKVKRWILINMIKKILIVLN